MPFEFEKIAVPLSYTDELYALRANINLVRKNAEIKDIETALAAERKAATPANVLALYNRKLAMARGAK